MTEKQLLNLKEQIDQAKSKKAELNGREKQMMETLKDKYGCTTTTQAKKKLDKIGKEIEVLKEQKEEGIKELEENYEF